MKKFVVHKVGNKILHDYAGMNSMAAKVLHFSPIHSNEILIDKNQSKLQQKKNIVHEEVEYSLMKKGMGYWKAHLHALQAEKMVKK